jgi:hypothetical protein
MARRPIPEDEQTETKGQVSTPGLDHLEKLASAAAAAAQAKQWRARQNGLQDQKCATSTMTPRPERKLKQQCSR